MVAGAGVLGMARATTIAHAGAFSTSEIALQYRTDQLCAGLSLLVDVRPARHRPVAVAVHAGVYWLCLWPAFMGGCIYGFMDAIMAA
jgi:hypothetical protein